jgi:transcription initiation factor TFIIIB Brf1 subunit/transcription initiation factor TFIIB
MENCPLCGSTQMESFFQDIHHEYHQCTRCALIFMDPRGYLGAEQEKREYDLHKNNPQDFGYRKFLSRLAIPLLERVEPTCRKGLDYGCGPGPTLSVMLEEAGCRISLFDPFYAPSTSVLTGSYDFITCTEVFEHFKNPARELELLLSLLKPQGCLAVMTKLSTGKPSFSRWHYRFDATHVSFFSRETFAFIAEHYNLD